MHLFLSILRFVKPYRRFALMALTMLTVMVVMDLAVPRLIQRIIDQGIGKNDRSLVLHTSLIMLGISAVSTVLAIANNFFSVRVGEGVARDLRDALFIKIQHFSFGNLDRQKTGQLLVRLTSDVNAVKALAQISLRVGTRAPLLMIGSLGLMISTSRSLALTMLPLLLVTTFIIGFFIVKMEPMYRIVQEKLDQVNTILQENVAGARLVKGLVRAEYEERRFEFANEAMTLPSIKVMQFMSSMTPALTLCINFGVVLVVWLGGTQAIEGSLSIGQLVAFTNYLMTMMFPLIMMTMLSNTWASGLASMRRINGVLDSVPEVLDAADASTLSADAAADVRFDRVSFAYGGRKSQAVLREISLHARPGKTIAILGSTGAGKSTLVNLIPRFYDVSSGTLHAFGADVRSLKQGALAEHIGVVPQESILFSGTIRDNIRYGRPDATDADVKRAAEAAQAHEFIAKMPLGYDSRIEQRGANFSGGQKQRLAIARALLLDPKLLILDDSTSAVDVETETKIQRALANTQHQRTTFIVAQRISTVLDADTILVLDKGQIVAEGTHAELMATSVVYKEIYESQLGGRAGAEGAPNDPARSEGSGSSEDQVLS